jgi:hypothetical protein
VARHVFPLSTPRSGFFDPLSERRFWCAVSHRKNERQARDLAPHPETGLTDLYAALTSAPKSPRASAFTGTKDYRSRGGFPRPAAQVSGAAVKHGQSASPQRMRAAE